MFDKLRNKFNSGDTSRAQSRRNSEYSNIGRSTVEVPTIITTPSSFYTDEDLPSYPSRSSSVGSAAKPRSFSTPGNISREQIASNEGPKPGSPVRPRRRHVFWRTGLWNPEHQSPSGPRVRASSQSVTFPHPLVVEEQMRAMPHHDWRGKNRPDGVWDNANVARLYV